MRRRGLLLVAAVATAGALALATGADARTIRLGWSESTPNAFGYPRMTFRVVSVTVVGTRWSVRAAVHNRSAKTIFIVRPNANAFPVQYGFGLLALRRACPRGSRCAPVGITATQSRPRIPRRLAPGASWTGVFGGRGVLPRRVLLSVSFGRFTAAGGVRFTWVTQRSFRL
ncbi:MAG: hypothetical protein M3321_01410 [Actinomycetota bacterium]|nr:hypothetical protein [Actinomycetota bacterium]